VMMPRMSGIELLRRIHERFPALPVLVLSAVPNSHMARQAAECGAFEYLSKPVEPEQLAQSIERALANLPLDDEPDHASSADHDSARVLH